MVAGRGYFTCASLLVVQMVEDKNRGQFEFHADNVQLALQARVRSYIDVLRGATALFQTGDHIDRAQFHAYVKQMSLESSFPGITILNVGLEVPRHKEEAFEAAVRADTSVEKQGYPDFAIKSKGSQPTYHVLTYLEPMESNRASFGVDIAANPAVANSLAVARDSGSLTSSGRLIQIVGPYEHVGLAMRAPLYRPGMPLDSVADRRAAYYGSVGAGFDIKKLMMGAFDAHSLRYMHLKLYDVGYQATDDEGPGGTLLLDSAEMLGQTAAQNPSVTSSDVFRKRVAMTVGPRVWEAEFVADKSAMVSGIDAYSPWLVLFGGLIGSTLLYSIYYSSMTARRHAIDLANEMTQDLRTNEASLAEAQHMARLGSWTLNPETRKMMWSAETRRIFGMAEFSEELGYEHFLDLIVASDRKKVADSLERTLRNGEEFTLEHQIMRMDGTTRWVQTISRLGQHERGLLLRGTIMDITERKQTVEALQRSQELLRDLTAHQDRVKEEERKRIAREIHDELGQTLLALRIDVAMLDARTGKSHPRLNEKVRAVLSHLDATVKTVRSIINNLRPAVLDLGLAAAIEWQVAEFRRRSGIECELVMGEREFLVDDARATSLFRILQESLTNVLRHAKASHVLIELHQENDRLVMKITDNGIGLYRDSQKSENSFGLVGVEERINALNGEFRITSAPGEGTTLTIYIPLPQETKPASSFKLVDSTE
jgi:PAS domain S-box-containing protein